MPSQQVTRIGQSKNTAALSSLHSIGVDIMKFAFCAIFITGILANWACAAADQNNGTYFLQFPSSDAKSLGQIDRLVVTVDCGSISALRNIPELYEINMAHDVPSVNVLEAQPRLGASAVELSGWSGVVGVHPVADTGRKSCFKVTVKVEGRTGKKSEWDGAQLGLPK